MVAVDGTGPARVAVRRLLRGVLLTAGLVAAGWLLAMLFATGSATADPMIPPDEPVMTGGLADDLGQMLTGSAQTVAVANPPAPAAAPVITPPAPPPPPVVAAAPPPAPVAGHPHKPAHRVIPATPARKPTRPAPARHRAPDQPNPAAAPVRSGAGATDHASHSDPVPDRTPPAPSAPTSSVSAGHDGPGEARGGAGLLSALAGPAQATGALTRLDRATTAAGRTAGLPAMSPD